MDEIPDVILDPPDEYDKIRNRHGCCGIKPNLYYNGTVHRIWVRHAYTFVVDGKNDIDEYLRQFGPPEWY